MSITRKDYALIANAIANAKLDHAMHMRSKALQGILTVQRNITEALAIACPGFNAEAFRAACDPKEG